MSATAPHVFVVYAAQDGARAGELVRLFGVAGRARNPEFEVFFDRESIPPGSEWQNVTLEALRKSSAAVVLLSPALFASHYVTKELTALIRRRETDPSFRIVPVMLAPTEPPGFLKGYQYLDGVHKDLAEVALQIVDAVAGQPVADKQFQPTGPAEYNERLQSISRAAARDERAGIREAKR